VALALLHDPLAGASAYFVLKIQLRIEVSAAIGHAAAPPISVMNSRRLIQSPRRPALEGWAGRQCRSSAPNTSS
jgi:hypothetical protein